MFYEAWLADAQYLETLIPSEIEIHDRVNYLLGDVALRATMAYSQDLLTAVLPLPVFIRTHNPFYVIKAPPITSIDPSSPLVGMATGGMQAGVVRQPDSTPLLVLPEHDTAHQIGQGSVLLHELEHLTEVEAGLPDREIEDPLRQIGISERRAYATNDAIFRAIDYSDYERYVESLPFEVVVTPNDDGTHQFVTNNIKESMAIAPPLETLIHRLWTEGGSSLENLLGTAFCQKAIKFVDSVVPSKTDKYLGVLLNTRRQP